MALLPLELQPIELVDFKVDLDKPGWVVFVSVDDRIVALRAGELRQLLWDNNTVRIITDAGPSIILRHVDRHKFEEQFAAFVQYSNS